MPLDYSKFDDIEDSDEEPLVQTTDNTGTKTIKGLSKKRIGELDRAAEQLRIASHKHCFLDFSVDVVKLKSHAAELIKSGFSLPASNSLGRVVVVLDQAVHAPRLCENFRSLCTGERGLGVGQQRLHYKRCALDLILPRNVLQVTIPNEFSCWGRYLDDEQLQIPGISCNHPGLVLCGNHGPNTNSCTFMITLNETQHLNGHNQIIGKVVRGMEVMRLIEALPTDNSETSYIEKNVKSHKGGKPLIDVLVQDCGELSAEDAEARPSEDDDIYPEHAIDWSCTNDYDSLLSASERIKELGNRHFKSKEYHLALAKYKKAQGYLEPLLKAQHQEDLPDEEPSEWLAGGVRPSRRTSPVRATWVLKLNVSQALLALEQWQNCLAVVNGVLLELAGKNCKTGNGVLPNDPLSVKALYRRARARVGLSSVPGEVSRLEEALDDLRQAILLDPSNRELRQELARVTRLQKEADSKGQQLYEGMLGGKAPKDH